MTVSYISFNLASTIMLAGAASGASIGGNHAANAIESTDDAVEPSSFTRAFCFACMTAAIGIASLHRDPAMTAAAVGVCFSASVCAMTLGLGVVLVVANRSVSDARIVAGRNASLLLPVALLTQLIGFSGVIHSSHAVMLVVEGVVLAPLWIKFGRLRQISISRIVQIVLSLALIALSGWAAVTAIADLATRSELFRPAIANSLVLGPVVVLPMIPILATLAENGLATIAIETLVIFVLMNLCLVLPILSSIEPGMTIPILSWRLDSMLLVAVGLLLMPPAIGRWTLGKREGMGLMVCFVVYLMVTLIATLG